MNSLLVAALSGRKVGAVKLLGSGPLDYNVVNVESAFASLALAYSIYRITR